MDPYKFIVDSLKESSETKLLIKDQINDEMVKAVSDQCTVPVIVGGGIRTPKTAREKVENGAAIIVTGNFFEDENNWDLIKDFASAVHVKQFVSV
ncbi:MAG: geranylgeranylglyceryl/heptaprenylglyceryl phosphate synthase [Ignavibacteria bacterium]|nr:geranylgeranylglyceryl/heptaprenylglyceryl phosphate synthase [Ignavibacteria bacterium]